MFSSSTSCTFLTEEAGDCFPSINSCTRRVNELMKVRCSGRGIDESVAVRGAGLRGTKDKSVPKLGYTS